MVEELPALSRAEMPETLSNDKYYVANDAFVKKGLEVMEEIKALEASTETHLAQLAKGLAHGRALRAVSKEIGRRLEHCKRDRDLPIVVQLISYWRHYFNLMDGPNELMRKQMLWRIAVDNERVDPKEATKALAELNRMSVQKKTGTGVINIVINNEKLPRGSLD